ncbi:hypothetical protein [Solidesulfovibrio alcoholivorans]|uniref:hypothetical protein n=1 Tax=Solidesulfovibrio alcoholivorans TaxID=81406 RepID=UPI000A62CB2C|nr:hypothetical protein [Solidesulfovibrio alcoholivorans]
MRRLFPVLALCLALFPRPAAAQQPPVPGFAAAPRPAYAAEAIPDPAASPPTPPHQDPARPDGGDAVRRQVSDERVFSKTVTCFYGPHLDQGQARRLCSQQARGRLLDDAAAALAHDAALANTSLSTQDLRAFVDSLLTVAVADEEIRKVPDGLAVRLTLHAKTPQSGLIERLAAFAANPQVRAAALAETATRDRQAAEARMAAIPFGADREFRAKEMQNEMREDAAFAARRVVPGMSMANVKELLGNPPALKQAIIGPETYVCAGYGKVWVVFRDGVVSCLRTRLDYVQRYGTDCHCAGNYATILKND